MMTANSERMAPKLLLLFGAFLFALPAVPAQTDTSTQQSGASSQQQSQQQQDTGDTGPAINNGPLVIRKKPESTAPPPAPAEPKVKNPGNANYSMRVDVPMVNLDVNVILDKTHQFVPGLKPGNFLVLEDGVPQTITSVRTTQAPITAVMLLEFAANSYYYIYDMQNAAYTFFQTLKPDDYIAVVTYDLKTHILTDFTNNKDVIAEALNSLIIPGFSDTDMFDALYEVLDRLSRIEGRKYVILIGTGVDTFSKLTLDKMLAKIKATPNVTIFTIGTGAWLYEMYGGQGGMMNGMYDLNYLQAQNQLKTFAAMTGGLSFAPVFQGELPDIFNQINASIRNQYVVTYRPTNTADNGAYRKVKVLLVDNEGHPLRMQDEKGHPQKYSIISRDGYYAKLPVQ